jgi:hypothetical protein
LNKTPGLADAKKSAREVRAQKVGQATLAWSQPEPPMVQAAMSCGLLLPILRITLTLR